MTDRFLHSLMVTLRCYFGLIYSAIFVCIQPCFFLTPGEWWQVGYSQKDVLRMDDIVLGGFGWQGCKWLQN